MMGCAAATLLVGEYRYRTWTTPVRNPAGPGGEQSLTWPSLAVTVSLNDSAEVMEAGLRSQTEPCSHGGGSRG